MVKKPGDVGYSPITIDTGRIEETPTGERVSRTTIRIDPELPPHRLDSGDASSVQGRASGQSSMVSVRQTTKRGNPKRTSRLKIQMLALNATGLNHPDSLALGAVIGFGGDTLAAKLKDLVPEGVEVGVHIVLGEIDPRNMEQTLRTAISDAIRNFQEVQ